MKLVDVRVVWLEKTGEYGFAVELGGTNQATGRIKLSPDDPAEKVIAALRSMADQLEQAEKNFGDDK